MKYFTRHKILTIILIVVSILIYIGYTSVFEFEYKNRTNKYYINSLYTSEQKTYKYYLNNNEKKAYDNLLENIKEHKKTIKTTDVFEEENQILIKSYYEKAQIALILDHPELVDFQSINFKTTPTYLEGNLSYINNSQILKEVNVLRIQKIINDLKRATIDMNDKEKIRYVYEWINKNVKYNENPAKNSIYNAFIEKEANDLSITKTVQVIFFNIGIESLIAVGKKEDIHYWNIVRYEDDFYHFDATIKEEKKIKYNGLNNEYFTNYNIEYTSWYPIIDNKNKLYK